MLGGDIPTKFKKQFTLTYFVRNDHIVAYFDDLAAEHQNTSLIQDETASEQSTDPGTLPCSILDHLNGRRGESYD